MSKRKKSVLKKEAKTMFIISPIGEEDSETRIYFDKVRRNIIEPIAKKLGYHSFRADDIHKPGTITKQIVEQLIKVDLVVADLSRKNPNVFYELAVRHAVGKPVILLGEKDEEIPFNLAAQRVIDYDFDPDHVREAKENLEAQIKEVETEEFITDSPIETNLIIGSGKGKIPEPSEETKLLAILRKQSEDMRGIRETLNEINRGRERSTIPSHELYSTRDFSHTQLKTIVLNYLRYAGQKSLHEISESTLIPPRTLRPLLRSMLIKSDIYLLESDPQVFGIRTSSSDEPTESG